MENKAEIWKAHPDIAGIEVSTLGRVRTLDRVTSSEKMTRFIKGRILKQHEDIGGYLRLCFNVNGKFVNKFVHRLVAETFIPNSNDLPQVNHKDCDRRNNNIDNLEWCDNSYNLQYREKFGKAQNKPVFAINLAALEVLWFPSQSEACRALGVFQQSISNVSKGTQKKTNGYWFVNDDGNAVEVVKSKLHDIGKTGLKLTA